VREPERVNHAAAITTKAKAMSMTSGCTRPAAHHPDRVMAEAALSRPLDRLAAGRGAGLRLPRLAGSVS